MVFELTASRIIAPYLGNTIYTWTSIIGVILAALAIGYACGGRLADQRKQARDIVFCLCAAAVVIMLVNIYKDPVLVRLESTPLPLQLQSLLASICLFAAPTLLLGAAIPYLSRLSITDIATSGQHLSRVSAAETIGSLAGTFMTGYFLFGLVGTRNLLSCLAVGLVLASLLVDHRSFRWWRLGLLAVIIAGAGAASQPQLRGVVKDLDTAYARVIVRDTSYNGAPVRVYQTDRDGLQSGVYTDGRDGLAMPYIRGFDYFSGLGPANGRYLMIGGGAFTFPQHIADSQPQATVDTVEVDGKLPAISRQYFGFKQPANLNIIQADGRNFLNRNHRQYDMVFLDAFSAASVPPFQLLTKEAGRQLSNATAKDGLLVANVIGATSGIHSVLPYSFCDSLRSSFQYVALYPVIPTIPSGLTQNVLVVASEQPIDHAKLKQLGSQQPEFAAMLEAEVPLAGKHGVILSDNYAPVEQLAAI